MKKATKYLGVLFSNVMSHWLHESISQASWFSYSRNRLQCPLLKTLNVFSDLLEVEKKKKSLCPTETRFHFWLHFYLEVEMLDLPEPTWSLSLLRVKVPRGFFCDVKNLFTVLGKDFIKKRRRRVCSNSIKLISWSYHFQPYPVASVRNPSINKDKMSQFYAHLHFGKWPEIDIHEVVSHRFQKIWLFKVCVFALFTE